MICHKSDENSVELCAEYLKNKKVLILPTDTVYGFSSIVEESPETDEKIKLIKGRDETKPFIQLIADPNDIHNYSDSKIPEKLLKYWPGPLTIIVSDKRIKNKAINTTAFRCPGDKWLRDIIQKCGSPIYSTSVNRSGKPVLETEKEIVEEFSQEADLIVLDGDRKNSLPSTIVKVDNDEIVVIRKGAVEIN